MEQKFYLRFLILYVILSFEVGASSSEDHVRKKRIINYTPGGNRPVRIEDVPYIVSILRNWILCCGGSILASNIILTAAHCIIPPATYHVLSGSERLDRGKAHNVAEIKIHGQYHTYQFSNDLALLKIFPPIDLIHSPNRHIELYNETVPLNVYGTVSGWGCHLVTPDTLLYPNELRSISLPILDHWMCTNFHLGYQHVSHKNICTFGLEGRKGICFGDSGGPLAVEGKLLGIVSWSKEMIGTPDVFIKVSHADHSVWITATMRMLNGQF